VLVDDVVVFFIVFGLLAFSAFLYYAGKFAGRMEAKSNA